MTTESMGPPLVKGRPLMIWGAEKISDVIFFFFLAEAFLNFFPWEGLFKFLENGLRIFFLDFLRPRLMVIPLRVGFSLHSQMASLTPLSNPSSSKKISRRHYVLKECPVRSREHSGVV